MSFVGGTVTSVDRLSDVAPVATSKPPTASVRPPRWGRHSACLSGSPVYRSHLGRRKRLSSCLAAGTSETAEQIS